MVYMQGMGLCQEVQGRHRAWVVPLDCPGAVCLFHALCVLACHERDEQIHQHHVEAAENHEVEPEKRRHLTIVVPVCFRVKQKSHCVRERVRAREGGHVILEGAAH